MFCFLSGPVLVYERDILDRRLYVDDVFDERKMCNTPERKGCYL